MKLSEGSLYVVKKDKEWIIAMFTGFEQGRARGVDWRWAVFIGPLGTFRIPASHISHLSRDCRAQKKNKKSLSFYLTNLTNVIHYICEQQ